MDAALHKYVIRSKGSEIHHIQNNFKVSVHIPNSSSVYTGILVVGEQENVTKAIAYINKVIEKALAPREEKPSEFEKREQARALEERGFDSLFLPEHTHIPSSRKTPFPSGGELPKRYAHSQDPFVSLSFAAAATKTLKLGTGICLVPQRDPIVTAKVIATLDRLSGGRFIFGIGGGWNVEEMENHGARYNTRFKLMRERILAMKAMWTEDAAEFHGEMVDFDPLWSFPKPTQKPHPPILLGGETDHTLKRVVEYCSGWFPRASQGFSAQGAVQRLRVAAAQAGRDMSTLSVTVFRAPAEESVMHEYRTAGIERALLEIPDTGRDEILKLLDDRAKLLR